MPRLLPTQRRWMGTVHRFRKTAFHLVSPIFEQFMGLLHALADLAWPLRRKDAMCLVAVSLRGMMPTFAAKQVCPLLYSRC